MKKKILFIAIHRLDRAPGQRFRFEQYFDVMTEAGIEFRIQSFLTKENWKIFYSKGQLLAKLLTLCSGYLRRFLILFSVPEFDFIFIHRELTPIGPPVFEWLIANVFPSNEIPWSLLFRFALPVLNFTGDPPASEIV